MVKESWTAAETRSRRFSRSNSRLFCIQDSSPSKAMRTLRWGTNRNVDCWLSSRRNARRTRRTCVRRLRTRTTGPTHVTVFILATARTRQRPPVLRLSKQHSAVNARTTAAAAVASLSARATRCEKRSSPTGRAVRVTKAHLVARKHRPAGRSACYDGLQFFYRGESDVHSTHATRRAVNNRPLVSIKRQLT